MRTIVTEGDLKVLKVENPTIKWIKTHPDAKLPTLAHPDPLTGDTGYDVYAVEDIDVHCGRDAGYFKSEICAVIPVGIEIAYITPGYWISVAAKSGLGFKYGLLPHPGIIDNSYRGGCGIKIYNFGKNTYKFKKGDKVAQLVIHQLHHVLMRWTDEKEQTARSDNGFGSTGR